MTTKPKRKPLADAVSEESAAPAAQTATQRRTASKVKTATANDQRPSRAGKHFIGGHFSPEVRKQIKMIAAEHDKTSQQLVAEGLNLMFESYGRTALAPTSQD